MVHVEKEGCDLELTPRLTSSAFADKNRAAKYVALGGRQGGAGQINAVTSSFFTSKHRMIQSYLSLQQRWVNWSNVQVRGLVPR